MFDFFPHREQNISFQRITRKIYLKNNVAQNKEMFPSKNIFLLWLS